MHGKQESRKELGLIASFHPNVFVVQTSTALQGHFLKNVMEFLNLHRSPAVLDVYTPCQAEHGIGDAVANRQARKAVESRMNPVFVHDPRRGTKLHSWFSLDGNPEPDQDWASQSIEYIDDNGATQLLKAKVTPADFAYTEVRFRKQFKPLKKDADGAAGRRVYRARRRRARRQDAVHLCRRRRQEAGQIAVGESGDRAGRGAAQILAHAAVSRRLRRPADRREPPRRTRAAAAAPVRGIGASPRNLARRRSRAA